jgi:Tol biopolymer transport system component
MMDSKGMGSEKSGLPRKSRWGPKVPVLLLSLIAFFAFSTHDSEFVLAAQGSWVAFDSKVDGKWQIFLAEIGTGNTIRLTDRDSDNQHPVWSPDGNRIAFISNRDGNSEIYVMDLAGWASSSSSHFPLPVHNLTRHPGQDSTPAWSSDGTHLAFVSDRDGNQEIYVMGSNGENPKRLTINDTRDYSPNWSPDSSRLAFVSRRDGNYEIYSMAADGTEQRNLTHHAAEDGRGDHSWSPDGQRIAWITDRDMNRDANWEIYIMTADGSAPENLTGSRGEERMGMAVWSPDGLAITFTSFRDGNGEIYIMGADGKNQRNLTRHGALDRDPVWSPQGDKIAFVSDRDGFDEIFVMESDGSGLERVSALPAGSKGAPKWKP